MIMFLGLTVLIISLCVVACEAHQHVFDGAGGSEIVLLPTFQC